MSGSAVRSRRYDVVVGGGGPAGAAAALALSRTGRRTLLVESSTPRRALPTVGESLPPGARPLLASLGVLELLDGGDHLRALGSDAVWGSTDAAATDFIFDPQGHGWHLNRERFDAAARNAAIEAGAERRESARVCGCERASAGWRVWLDDGRSVDAAAVIDATGRRATLGRALGARRARHDRLVGVIATARAAPGDTAARLLVEAGPRGWWYTTLSPGRTRVVAYMTDADLLATELRTLPGFRAALAATHRIHLAVDAQQLTPPRICAAHGSRLVPARGDGWLAVGDAALAFDPLSSQGIMTAVQTGLAGARELDADMTGDREAPARYVWRLTQIEAAYLRNRSAAYASEARWPDEPFWARRRG